VAVCSQVNKILLGYYSRRFTSHIFSNKTAQLFEINLTQFHLF
jgi:hypothetical protein